MLSLFIIMLISTSISDMELAPGLPFPGQDRPVGDKDPVMVIGHLEVYQPPLLLQGILGIACVISLVYLSILLIKSLNLRWIFHPGIIVLVLLIMGFVFVSLIFSKFLPANDGTAMLPDASPPSYAVSQIGAPPAIIWWIVSITLVLVVCAFVIWMFRYRSARDLESDAVLQTAEFAIAALQRGENMKNVIMNCYKRMEQAIREEMSIERQTSMTPREFEKHLQNRGLPLPSIHQLTSLFEAVRYGDQLAGKEMEKQGEACLKEIVSSIKGGGEKDL